MIPQEYIRTLELGETVKESEVISACNCDKREALEALFEAERSGVVNLQYETNCPECGKRHSMHGVINDIPEYLVCRGCGAQSNGFENAYCFWTKRT